MACEVHLGVAPNKDAVEIFLDAAKAEHDTSGSAASSSSSGGNSNVTCLFVWIEGSTGRCCIGDTLPERYESGVAFVGSPGVVNTTSTSTTTSTTATTTEEEKSGTAGEGGGDKNGDVEDTEAPVVRPQIPLQCVTLQPAAPSLAIATNPKEGDEGKEGSETFAPVEAPSSQATLLSALQLYTRHLFLPAISTSSSPDGASEEEKGGEPSASANNTAILQDKIRELDVAIHQSQRSARLPTVTLGVDPAIARVVEANSDTLSEFSGNIDWGSLGLEGKLSDDDYLNSLQSGVSGWIGQIRKLTVLPRTTPFPMISERGASQGADLEELAFWNQLNDELHRVRSQLKSPGVELTLAMLREAKRFVATLALQTNTGLDSATAYARDVEHFLKPYPVSEFVAARDFDKIGVVLNGAFDHLPKIRQSRYYTLERTAQLLSATTLTMRKSMERILRENYSNTLLFMDYKEYETSVRYPTQDVFVQFDDRMEEFKEFFLEQGRRRNKLGNRSNDLTPSKILEKLTQYQKPLEARLDQIHEFRSGHERLRQVVLQVLKREANEVLLLEDATTGSSSNANNETDGEGKSETTIDETANAIQTVENAPRLLFSSLDVLDLSPGGTKALESALEEYDLRMDAMEERLAKLLRDKLTACVDAEDMFRVFARFNPLLARTRVRIAVKEFQVQLIATVAKAVEKLQSKFVLKYESSSAARLSKIKGIPPVSGKILWAKQMERQVHALMERCSQVLGPNWGAQLEGRQLRKSGDELLAKLDAKAFFRNWVTAWEKELTIQASSRLNSYPIVVEKDVRTNELVATVNFPEKSETLSKEIRQLKWLGFDKEIPRSVLGACEEAKQRYPFAIAIKTALRSYQSVRGLVDPSLEPLVLPQLLQVREIVSEGFEVKLDTSKAVAKKRRIRWDSSAKELSDWVTRLSDSVTKLEERVEELLLKCDKIEAALTKLGGVDYDFFKFQIIMGSIQKIIDDMSLGGYPQLAGWVKNLDDRLAKVLAGRLSEALERWNYTFRTIDYDKDGNEVVKITTNGNETAMDGDAADEGAIRPVVHVPTIPIEILLRNQEISSVPAVPTCRSLVLNRLHSFIGIVCNLPRLKSGRYEVFDDEAASGSNEATTFERLIAMVPSSIVAKSYELIEARVIDMATFVDQWLAYQTLWDTQVADVATSVGKDIEKWQVLLLESAEARSAVDMSATSSEFGPVVVRYNKVQSQITLKYDSWQKELQSSFAGILGQCIADSHAKMDDAKLKLEKATLETSSGTENIVLGVTFIQEMKTNVDKWASELDQLEASERLIKRQRFHFGNNWMESTVVRGQFDLVKQVLSRRITSMEQQFPLLQARVSAEEKAAAKRSIDLVAAWGKDKPLRGNMSPQVAMDMLAKFETGLKKAQTHQQNLVRAKDALGLEHTAESNAISECVEELDDLKEVWGAVSKPHDKLQTIKDTSWASAIMRKVRRALDDLLAEMRSMPNRIRQYEPFIALHDEVRSYINGHGLMTELKTEALKERHWKTILKTLGTPLVYQQLSVGALWDKGILVRKKEMGEILIVAQYV